MTEKGSPGMHEAPGQNTLPGELSLTIKTTRSHQVLALVGVAFLCFEFVFLTLYFDQSWFPLDLRFYGIPAILAAVLSAHFLLLFGETKRACRWFSLIFKGKPVMAYQKWLEMDESGICFGLKHVRFAAIDELELTWLGNLVIKSRLVCGAAAPFPDKVLKVPFAVADLQTQQKLLAAIRHHKPELAVNKRLANVEKPKTDDTTQNSKSGLKLKAILQKSPQVTQMATAAIMAALLVDVGFSSFYYLELLKNYYLAETDLLNANPQESSRHFARAEDLRLHPLPFSWVSSKFLKSSSVASGIWEQRSRVLWLAGHHAEAIADGFKAIDEAPMNLRHRLYQTRLLVDENKIGEARQQLQKILEDHKHALMPRLYSVAIVKEREKEGALSREYKTQLDACYEDTYQDEPHWPPGGNCFFTELFYSDDTRFLLDRFCNSKYVPAPHPADSARSGPEKLNKK
jgi:hypothetical protein